MTPFRNHRVGAVHATLASTARVRVYIRHNLHAPPPALVPDEIHSRAVKFDMTPQCIWIDGIVGNEGLDCACFTFALSKQKPAAFAAPASSLLQFSQDFRP